MALFTTQGPFNDLLGLSANPDFALVIDFDADPSVAAKLAALACSVSARGQGAIQGQATRRSRRWRFRSQDLLGIVSRAEGADHDLVVIAVAVCETARPTASVAWVKRLIARRRPPCSAPSLRRPVRPATSAGRCRAAPPGAAGRQPIENSKPGGRIGLGRNQPGTRSPHEDAPRAPLPSTRTGSRPAAHSCTRRPSRGRRRRLPARHAHAHARMAGERQFLRGVKMRTR